MTIQVVAILMFSLVCLATPAWADFEAGMEAYRGGEYAAALYEWRTVAEKGDVRAQFYLGRLYDFGQGVPQDYVQAWQWYGKAAARGYAKAQYLLGRLYVYGKGVPQDYATARQWFEKAAAQGDGEGQYYLGWLYADGKGVPQDFVVAHMWYNLAAANGEKVGEIDRDALAKQMTPSQIAEAQKLAREWKPKILTGVVASYDERASRPQDARGNTPIRFVICNDVGQDCFVIARFKDLQTCEDHKRLSAVYCDSVSTPGKMLCDTTRKSEFVTSWCLP